MSKIIFYKVGNGDTCLIKTNAGKKLLFDFCQASDENLSEKIKNDIDWTDRTPNELDVLAITHLDKDHICDSQSVFYFNHATKYQSHDRIKFKTLWIPAAVIVECGTQICDDSWVIRAEARYRLREGKGVRIFGRPESIKNWLEENKIDIESVRHLFTGAGQLVSGLSLETDKFEVFVHSPFYEKEDDGDVDRNTETLIVSIKFKEHQNCSTNLLMLADADSDLLHKIVGITEAAKNTDRLKWDIMKIAHHCSYKALNKAEKGKNETIPVENVEKLMKYANPRAVMVASCKEVEKDSDQPPHHQAYATYKKFCDLNGHQIKLTADGDERIIIDVGRYGCALDCNDEVDAMKVMTSSMAPRVG